MIIAMNNQQTMESNIKRKAKSAKCPGNKKWHQAACLVKLVSRTEMPHKVKPEGRGDLLPVFYIH
jgi:hypothetical protein